MVKEYFSHDYNTRSDIKIKKLLLKHDYLGYGLWWGILEELYKNGNSMTLDYESLAYDFRTSADVVKSILNDFELFVISADGKSFSSESVSRRLSKRNEVNEYYRNKANLRWGKKKDDAQTMPRHDETDAQALPTHNESNAQAMPQQSPGNAKEKKGNKRKTKESVFTPPQLSEFVEYFVSNGFRVDVAHRAWKGYDAANWHDTSGRPVLSWKQKCQMVWFTDNHRMPEQGAKPMVH